MTRGTDDPQDRRDPGVDHVAAEPVTEPVTERVSEPISEPITELGIDVIRVARIRNALDRFGERFSRRVLTEAERGYVRNRPETFAGRWAAKEAVSKVLGLGVRGIGWRDIEVERLPTGQPAVRLHGRAAARAAQLGMGRIALSITHESDYALAIAVATRTAGGRYVFPLDIDERLDERERRLLARFERLRTLHEAGNRLEAGLPAGVAAPKGRSAREEPGEGLAPVDPDPGAEPDAGGPDRG
jgi:holo-[acyl-carrier protein] synthase